MSDNATWQGIVAVTQTLIEEHDGGKREVRVVVHSLCLIRQGMKPTWVAGQRTVAATGRAAVETNVSFAKVRCHFTVEPRAELTWEQVASHHDLQVTFK